MTVYRNAKIMHDHKLCRVYIIIMNSEAYISIIFFIDIDFNTLKLCSTIELALYLYTHSPQLFV